MEDQNAENRAITREERARKRAKAKAAKATRATMQADWLLLGKLIAAYVDAAVAESWKGGGDPDGVEILELRFKIANMELNNHIKRMQEWNT